MFYDRFLELCAEKGVKPTRACTEAGLSRGLAAKWKATGTEKPSAEALEKMSVYFQKSIDEILNKERPHVPEDIGPNKQKILNSVPDLTEAEAALLLERIEKIKESRV